MYSCPSVIPVVVNMFREYIRCCDTSTARNLHIFTVFIPNLKHRSCSNTMWHKIWLFPKQISHTDSCETSKVLKTTVETFYILLLTLGRIPHVQERNRNVEYLCCELCELKHMLCV